MTASGERGIDIVIGLLTSLAAGDLDARGARAPDDEDLDAVIVGINMLAEELGAHRAELEQRVQSRTVELEAARKEAMEASRLKSEFLATMSHEIRTPMNGVIGLTNLLRQTQLDQTQRLYVEGLHNAGDALLKVINDILDFSKLEARMVDLELVDFDPRALVEAVAGLLAPTSSRKELELIAYCSPEVPSQLVGDEVRLRQILLNLGSNAVKFTEKGEVVITARVSEVDPGRLRFQVSDSGIGIPEDAQRAVFDSFTQADASTTRKYGGSGLGLAISRKLTEAMGGVIGLESEEGVGSTFWFEVPLQVSATAAPPSPGRDLLRGLRVLVVDDNATNRLVLESQLTEWGMRPDVVEHPQAVVHLMRSALAAGDPYAMALLDMCMPQLDGLELAGLISADETLAGTLLIVLSSVIDIDRDALRRAGVRDTLSKPVRGSELFDRLVTLVAGAPTMAARTVEPVTPFRAATTARVLVVEDNTVNQLVAEGLVSHLGYAVDIVANGAEAVDAVADTAYAAVLMDCHMPVMDGYSATEEIRRREAGGDHVPIIAMTAGATSEDRERCLASGMDAYISKPIDETALSDVLRRWARPAHGVADRSDEPAVPPEPDAPVIDQNRLSTLRGLGGSDGRSLLVTLTDAFMTRSPVLLASMRRMLDTGDSAGLRSAAHELAGSAANIGAVRVADLARRVEVGGQPAALELLDRLGPELERAGRSLRHDLADELATRRRSGS